MRVTLGAGAIVAGTLLDPDGAPIDGGLIEMLAGESFHAVTTTQPDGSFSEVVPAGSTVMLVFSGSTTKGYRLLATDPITVPAENGALVLQARTVKLVRTLTVKAVDPDGNPIEGVGIVASPTVDDLRKVPKTGANGTVLLEGLPDARIRVSIFIEHPHAQTRHLAPPQPEWVVPQGQTLELRWKRPAPVSGVVLLPDGRPAAGVPIELLASESGSIIANGFTDAEGRFELIVPEGEHESVELVIAPADAGLRTARRPGIRPGTSGISIRLEPRE